MIKRILITAVTLVLLAGCGTEEKAESQNKATNLKSSQNKASLKADKYERKPVNKSQKQNKAATTERQKKPAQPQFGKLITKGERIRPFNAKSHDGNTVSTNSFEGKYTLIDFWASWCPPCRKEIPHIAKLATLYKDNDNFQVIGVSLDRSNAKMVDFIKKNKMDWINIYDANNGNIAAKYGVSRIPFTILIDPQGKVIATGLRGEAMINEVQGRVKS